MSSKARLFSDELVGLADHARALSHPARIAIVRLLLAKERFCGDLVSVLPLSQPTVSRHLAELREAGLIEDEAWGNKVCYRVNREHLRKFCCAFSEAFAEPGQCPQDKPPLAEDASADAEIPDEKTDPRVHRFLGSQRFAVAGASSNRDKFGNKCLRALLQSGRQAQPMNPRPGMIEGIASVRSLRDMDEPPDAVSIITPPKHTRTVVRDAIAIGVKRLWMQPGAEEPDAIAEAENAGLEVIAGGPCLLIALDWQQH